MAAGEENGKPAVYGSRDDDRASDSPYSVRRRSNFGAVMLLGLVMIGAFLAYVAFNRPAVDVSGSPTVPGRPGTVQTRP